MNYAIDLSTNSLIVRFIKLVKNKRRIHLNNWLLSITDISITYFEEVLEAEAQHYDKMYIVVNALGTQFHRVSQEAKTSLTDAGLLFNLYPIVGGKLENDKKHELYLLYPEDY